jgi:hypothetical protein
LRVGTAQETGEDYAKEFVKKDKLTWVWYKQVEKQKKV